MKLLISLTLVVLCTLSAAPSFPAEESTGPAPIPGLTEAEENVNAWRVDQAEVQVQHLLSEYPDSVDVLDLATMLQYYQGDYTKALQTADKAVKIDPESEQRQALRLLIQRTHDTVKDFRRFESDHFILYLDEQQDGILGPPALAALEKAYETVAQELGYSSQSKIRVEIAPGVTEFNAISTLSLRDIEETGAIGLCKFNKVMIISPRVLAHGYRWLDSLAHEYLHYAIVHVTRNKAPIWLHEGLARYYETIWRKAPDQNKPDYLTPANETLLARAVTTQEFISFKDMEPSLIRLDTPEQVQLAYAEAASAIDYVRASRGSAGIRQFLQEVGRGSTASAIEQVMDMPFDTFESTWHAFLKEKGLKEIDGTSVRKYKVADDQLGEDTVDLQEIQSVVARNRTRLGDRLWQRGNVRAATAEYRRALKAGPNSTIILNKLGQILIKREIYDGALPHLEKARYLSPDTVKTYLLLGQLHHETGDQTQARTLLEEALQINPFHPMVYHLLGQTYEALGQSERAAQAQETLRRISRRS